MDAVHKEMTMWAEMQSYSLCCLISILYMYVITVHMCTSGTQFKPRVLMLLPRVLLYLSTSNLKVECQCPALISLSNDIIYLYIFLCFRKSFNYLVLVSYYRYCSL